jgi:Rrf2 family protein
MPERFLLQVMRCLVEHGVLSSTRGVQGGYVLARRADRITLFDIIEAVDRSADSQLPNLRGLGTDSRARLIKTLHGASQAANAELKKMTIANLARTRGRR